MVRHAEVLDSAILLEHYPIFREAEKVIADPVVRNRGTSVVRSARPTRRGPLRGGFGAARHGRDPVAAGVAECSACASSTSAPT